MPVRVHLLQRCADLLREYLRILVRFELAYALPRDVHRGIPGDNIAQKSLPFLPAWEQPGIRIVPGSEDQVEDDPLSIRVKDSTVHVAEELRVRPVGRGERAFLVAVFAQQSAAHMIEFLRGPLVYDLLERGLVDECKAI